MKIVLSLLIFGFSFWMLQSCDKNKELIRYSEYYHIDGNDTISAIYIPNSFTPDGDAINDVFNIYIINGSDENQIDIFNNNGILMFSSSFRNWNAWDGIHKSTMAKTGQYSYKLRVRDYAGYVYNIEGVLNLIR